MIEQSIVLADILAGLGLAVGLLTIPVVILGLISPGRFYPFTRPSRVKAAVYGIIVLPVIAAGAMYLAVDVFYQGRLGENYRSLGVGIGLGIGFASLPVIRSFFSKKKTFVIMGSAAVVLALIAVTPIGFSGLNSTEDNPIQKAAERGDASAQFKVGNTYNYGQGVPQDYAKARHWYLKAAEQGNARAQVNLGYLYDSGRGGPQDDAEARKWYLKSAKRGNATAQRNLAILHNSARGGPQDKAEARKWYLMAADQGNVKAQYDLGVEYNNTQDYAEARKYFLEAAKRGHTSSHFNIGLMYDKGQGGPQNYVEARKWYQKAAERGSTGAQVSLAQLFYKGQGGRVDYKLAYAWYHAAAEQGHEKAITNRRVTGAKLYPASLAEARKLAALYYKSYVEPFQ